MNINYSYLKNEYPEIIQKKNTTQKPEYDFEDPYFYSMIYNYFMDKFKDYPDALDAAKVALMTGFGKKTVYTWISKGWLRTYYRTERIIPKKYLLDFCCTPYFIHLYSRSFKIIDLFR